MVELRTFCDWFVPIFDKIQEIVITLRDIYYKPSYRFSRKSIKARKLR